MAILLIAALMAALGAAPASAITRAAADRAALSALGSADGSAPVIVFRAGRPLAPGTAIAEAGAARTAANAAATDTPARRDRLSRAGATITRAPVVLRVGSEPAWLYYEDRGPFQLFEHPGRVALVGERSGDVELSRVLSWPPLANGRLPRFMRSAAAYRNPTLRAFARLPRTGGRATGRRSAARAVGARAAGADRAATALAAQDACAVTVADMLDNAYDYASVDRTRAAFGGLLAGLEKRNSGFVAARYSTRAGLSPTDFASRLARRHGCRSVLLFIAGGGVRGGETTISLGASAHASGRLEQQDLRVSQLRALLRAHPGVDWQLVVDAPYAGGLIDALRGEPNLQLLITASEHDEPTYACIPGAARLCSATPSQLAFTSRLLSGIETLLADTAAVDRANAAAASAPQFLGRLVAEGYERGTAAAALRPFGVHPQQYLNFGRRPAPPNTSPAPSPDTQGLFEFPVAQDRSVTTDEDRAVAIDLARNPIQALLGTFTVTRQPAHGRLSGTGPNRVYTPDPDYTGPDSFQFVVRIAFFTSGTGTISIDVRPINDAPIVTTAAGTTAYAEGDPPVAVDPALTVRDVDSPNLTGATARIGAGYARGQDLLAFRDTAAITGRWDAATGVLTLRGRATVADYQAALRSITYDNSSPDPTGGPRTIAFDATDGALTSAPATRTLDVTAVNDPPVVTIAGGDVAYTENDPATPIDPALTVRDVDSANLSGATATITRGHAAAEDVLSATPAGSITARYDAPSGVLTLSGRATVAEYETTLHTLAYLNRSDAPSPATRTVTVVATDTNAAASAPVSRDVTVRPVNDVPDATNDAYSTDEDTPLSVNAATGVLANDRDLDGDTLTVVEVDGSAGNVGTAFRTTAGAQLRVNADGSLSYDPSGALDRLRTGETVRDTITYRASDGRGGNDTATVDFTVTGVNDPPVAADDAYATDEDTPLSVNAATGVLANDRDAESETLTVAEVDGSAANVGTAFRTTAGAQLRVNADGSLSYDPSGALDRLRTGDTLRDTVTYRVSDGRGGTDTATIELTITGVNDAPNAADDAYTTGQDTPLSVNAASGVLANDRDAESDTLTVAEVDGSAGNVGTTFRTTAGGQLRVNTDGSLSYDPDGQFDGLGAGDEARDSVTYRVSDGRGGNDTATIVITITGANDPPVAADDAYRTDEDTLLSVNAASGLLANDRDPDRGDTLTVAEVDGSAANVGIAFRTTAGAQLRVNADGSLSYDPSGALDRLRAGDTLRDTVTYRVSDGRGGNDTATIEFTITGVNDAPNAADDAYRTDEDTPLSVNAASGLLANDRDADGDTLTVAEVDGSAGNVGTAFRTTAGAQLRVNADGSLSYDPSGALDRLRTGETVRDTITYRASDGRGGNDTATIEFTITGVNDPPVATDDSYRTDEDTPLTVNAASGVLANDRDAEGDTLTVDEVDGSAGNVGATFAASSGALVTVNADGSLRYDPNGQFNNLRAGDTVRDTVTYRVSDGRGGTDIATIAFTLSGVNDPPVAGDNSYTTDEDTALTRNAATGVLPNDSDPDRGDVLTVDQVDGSAGNVGTTFRTTAGAQLRLNADGSFSYNPAGAFDSLRPGDQVRDNVTYRVTDGSANDTATIEFTITGVNDAPNAVDDSYDGVGNTTLVVSDPVPAGEAAKQLTGSVSTNDRDPDNLPASLSVRAERVSSTLGGSATIDSDGSFTYTPPTGVTSATDTFDYRITDGSATDVGTISVRLADQVWYVDNTEAAGGTGRSSDAFDTLAEATAASGTGDTIYVHRGDTTTNGMNAGAVLDTNERLLGEATDLVVRGDQLFDGTAARRPSIGNAAGAGVTLATGSRVEGLAIRAAGGAAIAGGAGTAGSAIADVRLTGSAGGLALSGTSGTFDVSDTTISTTGGTGLAASGAGTLNLTSAGTITVSSSGGRGVDVANTALSGTLDDVAVTGSAAGGVSLQTTTGSIAFGGVSVSASGGTGFLADRVARLSLPAAATANVSNSGGTAVAIRNSSSPDATFDTVSATGAGATGIDVSGNSTGGTTTFSGTTTVSSTTATGVRLDANGAHSVAFTGGSLGITSTSGRGLDATGSGTVTVQGVGNTIGSTTGTPLRVQNVAIGAADVTFQSIAANGAANGIVLDTTGGAGGLTVTGTGTANSGGTIQNIRGADGSSQGVGVYLNATTDVSLTAMHLANNDGHAIRGTTVNGFSLARSAIDGTNGTNVSNDEGAVSLQELTGTSSITRSAISGGVEDNVDIGSSRGTSNLTLDGNDLGSNGVAQGGNSLYIEARGTAVQRTTVNDSDFRASREDLFQQIVTDTARSDLTVSANRFVNAHTNKVTGGAGVLLNTNGSGAGADLVYRIQNNRVSGTLSHAIMVQKGTGIAAARGRIENNQVGLTGVVDSGSREGSGIVVEARGQGSQIARITGNTVRRFSEDGIKTVSGEDGIADNGTVNVDLTVTGNTVAEPGPITGAGFRAEVADSAAVVNECIDLQGNTLTGSGVLGSDIRVFHDFDNSTFRLPGYAGGSHNQAAVIAYFAGRNTASTTFASVPAAGAGYVNAGAGCAQPPA
ncbi:Ig-like domain-containing protein [Conexibacter woesei]|uniref:Outer membrane adhesin like protein n=1 Tax=Conexibacter woesei (strain DSM 14684 / CCUG 47730 / CIP 108061 / JCM 11494 / NBRC 100937 / ID131577) TaxID=469383 RepID=D3FEP6_CONWI|nr:Ig-like domain-containing protein [Conexibacter woesei]ADB49720.1 outer membrane adhesin like protein [Conexibacter woesei DSM 14684]